MSISLALLTLNAEHAGLAYRGQTLADLRGHALPEAAILAAVKSALKVRIDGDAEALRSRLATPGAGQAMEYQEAFTQAAAADKAKSGVTPENYPMLAASIGIDIDPGTGQPAADVAGVARSVLAARDAWVTLGAEIRRVRLTVKQAIDGADTLEGAAAAADAARWPTIPS